MGLNVIFVLLISSVVIASGKSCENDGNVTAQDIKYYSNSKEFFYIHGLTNGESVVMYRTPNADKIQVQYTFINDECLYETQSYNIIEDGTIKDHVKVLKKRKDFSIRKKLSYMACYYEEITFENFTCKAVEIKLKINENGFKISNEPKGQLFRSFDVEKNEREKDEGFEKSNDVSAFELFDDDRRELSYMNNGRYFYQQNYGKGYSRGSYAFKTSNGFHAIRYNMKRQQYYSSFISDLDYEVSDVDNYRDQLHLSAKYQEKQKEVFFYFESTGPSIAIIPDNVKVDDNPIPDVFVAPRKPQ